MQTEESVSVMVVSVLYLSLVIIFGLKSLKKKNVMRLSPKKGDGLQTQLREMGLKKQWARNSLFMIRGFALLVS